MFKYIIYGKNLSKFSKLFTFLGKCGLQIFKIRAVLQTENAWTKRHIIERGCSMVKSGI